MVDQDRRARRSPRGCAGSRRRGARSPPRAARPPARRAGRAAACRRRPGRSRPGGAAPAPSVPTRRWTSSLEADEGDRGERRRGDAWRVTAACARARGARSRTPTGWRWPARSGTCGARPIGPAGSRPSPGGRRRRRCTEPPDGRTKPLSTLKNVVLPAPFGPISPHVPRGERHRHLVDGQDATEADGEVLDVDHGAVTPRPEQAADLATEVGQILRHLLDDAARRGRAAPAARRCRRGW